MVRSKEESGHTRSKLMSVDEKMMETKQKSLVEPFLSLPRPSQLVPPSTKNNPLVSTNPVMSLLELQLSATSTICQGNVWSRLIQVNRTAQGVCGTNYSSSCHYTIFHAQINSSPDLVVWAWQYVRECSRFIGGETRWQVGTVRRSYKISAVVCSTYLRRGDPHGGERERAPWGEGCPR
jgi:hypothetical protein